MLQITGAVLAGGRSRRMGKDKRLLSAGGKTLLQRAVDLLAGVCAEVLYAAPEPPPVPLAARHALDRYPGLGVLSGIHASLLDASHDLVLAIPVDTPLLSERWLRLLAGVAEKSGTAACPRLQGRIHPVPGCYPKSALPAVEAALRSPDPTAWRVLETLKASYVDEASAAAAGCGLEELENVNTAREWGALLARFASEG